MQKYWKHLHNTIALNENKLLKVYYLPELLKRRSDLVNAPGLSLAFPLTCSLVNLGWTRGTHTKSYLKEQKKKDIF